MKKRAVLVGTNTYNGLANPLSAPTTEVGFWKDILERNYGFATGNIITLPEKKATHEAVLGAIERQLRGLEPGDIFLFFGAGHGRIVHAHEQFAQYKYEEALMVWPAAGDKTLISAELTDSDLTEVFRRAAPPLGSKIAVMIDACFSGRLNIPLPPDAKPLTLPPVEDFSRASGALV
ncbi:MAG TPA: caspase family protein, partial [Thermoanaerobaculia bacterium]|nr:caspase family protein [Thermoanaerobaculia bacterium]